jgi:tetratricopeptide (TPR) repeat protein
MKIITVILILFLCAMPAYAKADYSKADEYLRSGDLDSAERELNDILARDGKDTIALTGLSEIYMKKGERGKALNFAKKAAALEPGDPITMLFLGKAYFVNNDIDNASEEFEKYRTAMKRIPMEGESKDLYVKDLQYISHAYLISKKYDEAYPVLEEIISIAPANQTALYNMGVYYYEYKHDRSQAYKSWTKAVEADKSSLIGRRAAYAIEYMRSNPDSRFESDFSFLDNE